MSDTAPPPAVERTIPPAVITRVANPVLRRLLASPLHRPVSGSLLRLELTGRKTGRTYRIPVGHHEVDGVLTVFTSSPWRVNLRGGADVTVLLRGRRRPARATLVEDPDQVARAYATVIDRLGWQAAQRRLGIRIRVGRAPTHAELVDAVRRAGLSLVRLDLA